MLGWRCQRIRLLDADTKAGVTCDCDDYTGRPKIEDGCRLPGLLRVVSIPTDSTDIVDEPKPSDKTPSRRLPEARRLDL